jgi:retron-type reverse transcriptase
MKTYHDVFPQIVSIENLLAAWEEFECGKKSKPDVQAFSLNLMDNIIELHDELVNKTYRHGSYYAFNISDPKPRHIHKATVRDRVLHRAIYRILYPIYDPTFISDSFSCRKKKGTHKALDRLRKFFFKVSQNNTRTVWALKCDVKKFFASIGQDVLMKLLSRKIQDPEALWLFEKVLESFHVGTSRRGLPLGNITSQLFSNVYLNELDQFMKQRLKARYYIRYADDFVILSRDREWLESVLLQAQDFVLKELRLTLHPDKIVLKTFASGIDFLGYVHFPHHRVLRTTTKRRMMRKVQENPVDPTLQSYLGLMKHGDTFKQQEEALNLYWINQQ